MENIEYAIWDTSERQVAVMEKVDSRLHGSPDITDVMISGFKDITKVQGESKKLDRVIDLLRLGKLGGEKGSRAKEYGIDKLPGSKDLSGWQKIIDEQLGAGSGIKFSGDIIYNLDIQGNFTFVNPIFEKITGYYHI